MEIFIVFLSSLLFQTSHEARIERFPCGIPRFALSQGPNRINNGWEAERHSLPWHVHIVAYDSAEETRGNQCGGSLIRAKAGNVSDMVLTAAHCLYNVQTHVGHPPSRIVVTVAVHNIADRDRTRIRVAGMAMGNYHTEFGADDIALLRLMNGVPYTPYTIPVCLPVRHAPLPVGKKCYVSGHGSISASAVITPDQLMMTEVDVITKEECASHVNVDSKFDFEKQFCAGTHGSGARSGDSGGALVCHESGRFIQYGIVSFGQSGISAFNQAGKYTFVPKYVGWIKEMDRKMVASRDVLPAGAIHEFLTAGEKMKLRKRGRATVGGVLQASRKKGNPFRVPSELVVPSNTTRFYECGVPSPRFPIITSPSGVFRITGGWEAQKHSLPWMVIFYAADPNNPVLNTMCGGTLIALESGNQTETVLTAASCVTYPSGYRRRDPRDCTIAIGVQNQHALDSREKRIGVKTFITHPEFRVHSTKHDIALIRLLQYAPFTEYSKPICLPEPGEVVPVGTECIVSGWGYGSAYSTLPETHLTMTTVSIANFNRCAEVLPYALDRDDFICTESSFRRGFCDGDTGGPLICKRGSRWVQYGVISKVVGQCGKHLDTYGNLSSYVHWISQADSLMARANELFPPEFVKEYINPLDMINEPRRRTVESNYRTWDPDSRGFEVSGRGNIEIADPLARTNVALPSRTALAESARSSKLFVDDSRLPRIRRFFAEITSA